MKKNASEVAKRYAIALFELAKEQNSLEKIVEEAHSLQPFLPVVSNVLVSPIFSDDNKKELLNTLIGLLKIGSTLGNTLRLVLRNRRFGMLPNIFKMFFEMVDSSMGISRGTLTSARTLDAAKLAEFEAALSAHTGKKVQLVARVEESLRAGYVVEVEGTVIDASLKTRLKNLRESLSRGV
jgi:F-type H+-transporting ATPase subunit delta